MKHIISLLKPRMWTFRNSTSSHREKGRALRLILVGGISIMFLAGIFAISLRVLIYFKSIEDLGDLLAFKLLSMILITLFSLMIFSSILTILSKLYLSKDLFLVHSMPVSSYEIFGARWFETTLDSSWMVIVFTFPVFVAYGIVNQAGWIFYAMIIANILALSFIASAISSILVLLAAVTLPANRIRSIFLFLGLFLFMILFILFRLIRPERLVNPETFASVLIYLQTLQTPASPFLPSTWAYESMKATLAGNLGNSLFNAGLSWSFAIALAFLTIILADSIYFRGFSRAQVAAARLFRGKPAFKLMGRWLSGPIRALASKEIRTFFRDQTQWSQIFLVGALIVIYVYNFKVLPLEKAPMRTIYLQNLLSFLNMGLAAFVLTALSARFTYPAISCESEAFWIIRSAPINLKRFLWVKFMVYFIPLLILTEILIVATNIFLQVTTFMMVLSVITIGFVVPGVVAIGIGLGAAYPDFKIENPVQSVTSFGGLIFMILSAAFIMAVIVLEAGPVYNLFMANLTRRSLTFLEWIWTVGSFTAAFIISILAIILPMRFGARRLARVLI